MWAYGVFQFDLQIGSMDCRSATPLPSIACEHPTAAFNESSKYLHSDASLGFV